MAKKIQDRLANIDAYVSMAIGLAIVLLVGALSFNYFSSRSRTPEITDSASTPSAQMNGNQAQTPLANRSEYTVNAGDTLWNIAQQKYNSGYNWVDIAKANNLADANSITAGQKLTLPQVSPIPTPKGEVSSASTDKPAPEKYTVKTGDSLWNIAVSRYNDGYRWSEIARANSLANPNLIHPGNTLNLP